MVTGFRHHTSTGDTGPRVRGGDNGKCGGQKFASPCEWVRLNGDPRSGSIDWVEWVEKIPANFETRYYVMRVIGNAVTYSHMYPQQAGLPRTVDTFLP